MTRKTSNETSACAPSLARDRVTAPADDSVTAPADDSAAPVISRRDFMTATVGAAVAGVAGAATLTLAACSPEPDETPISEAQITTDESGIAILEVPEEQVLVIDEFEELPYSQVVVETARWQLPIGTLVFQSSDEKALVLLPVDAGQELRTVGLLDLETGAVTTILEHAVGVDEGMIIYDARASNEALIWVECSLRTRDWRVYVMLLGSDATGDSSSSDDSGSNDSDASDGEGTAGGATDGIQPRLVDEGSVLYDPPLLAISTTKAYWTVMPDANGTASQEDSYLKAVQIKTTSADGTEATASTADEAPVSDEPYTVYTSHGRMITNPLVSDDLLTFVPRVDTDNVYYQITALNIHDDVLKTMNILPQSMRVSDAVYLSDTLALGVERNYDHAGGLAWFGTYQSLPDGRWLRISRMPTSAPVRLGDWLIVKSTINAVGIDAAHGTYFVIDVLADCIDYGDVLAGWGTRQRLVIYTSLPDRGGYGSGVTTLRVFELLPPAEAEAEE
ncbi:MAG: hypothetical protein LBI64_00875 [Coriobacteriales bacterium]|jgi:hypothetical protein|nr:hypothetical protein [Coriobacteriales bacterium]